MATATVAAPAHRTELVVRVGRVALVTQGLLYGIVGLLAARVAGGDHSATPSQRGAIASVARQPFGRGLLVAMAVGLATHALWRLLLAVRGEPGNEDEDGGSVAKRLANVGRSAIYASFTVAAIRVVSHTSGGDSGKAPKRSTAMVLGWPGGRVLVIGAGLAVIGAALWNLRKGVTRSFVDNLDLHELEESKQHVVEVVGIAGYLARAGAFGLVGWFLLEAGLHRNAAQTQGLDGALHELAAADQGPLLLGLLAVGLVLFGAFRILDGWYRKPSEIAYA